MIRPGTGHRSRRSGYKAFTLFEVLVALALSTLLIAAVYSGLDLYFRVRIAGEDEVQQAQVARAVLQRIEEDLRATVYQPTSSGDLSSTEMDASSSNGTSDSENTTVAKVIDPADANRGGNNGLIGDSTSLVLSISLPQSHAGYAAVSEGPIGLPTSDLRSVTYLLAGQGLGALSQAVADRFPDVDMGSSTVVGLARIEGDRLLLSQADAVSDVDTIASQAQLLAQEIKSLQFEYTDGIDWFESWDSPIYGSLPRAVRITLSFEPLTSSAISAEAPPARLYHLVVVLPPSDPISGGGSSDYESEGDDNENQ